MCVGGRSEVTGQGIPPGHLQEIEGQILATGLES
jgi:hypothetical protein